MGFSKDNIISLLRETPLFSGLEIGHLQELSEKITHHVYNPGHILIEEGIISQRVIYIIHGLVKVYKISPEGKEIFLAIEKDKDFLGLMDLKEKPGSATIEVLRPTEVIIFYKKDLVALLEKNPFLWERMYHIILTKLEEYRDLQSILLSSDLYNKTYILLKYLAQFTADKTIILSQEDIASLVGATRPRVTEALHNLQDKNKIILSPKRIKFIE